MPPGVYPFLGKKKELPSLTMSEFRARVEKAGKEWKGNSYAAEWNRGKIEDGTASFRLVEDPPPTSAMSLSPTMRSDFAMQFVPPVSPGSVPDHQQVPVPPAPSPPGPGEIDPAAGPLDALVPQGETRGLAPYEEAVGIRRIKPTEPIPGGPGWHLLARVPAQIASGGLGGLGSEAFAPAENGWMRALDVATNVGGMVLSMKGLKVPGGHIGGYESVARALTSPMTRQFSGLARAPGIAGKAGAAARGARGFAGRAAPAAIEGAATFGLYNASAPAESLDEWRSNVRDGVIAGGVLGVGGEAVHSALGGVGIAAEKAGKYAYDTAVMTAMGIHEGEDPKQALLDGLIAAGVFGATGAWSKQKDPYGGLGRWANERGREIIDSGVISPEVMNLSMRMAELALKGDARLLLPEESSAALRGGGGEGGAVELSPEIMRLPESVRVQEQVLSRVTDRFDRLLPEHAASSIRAEGREIKPTDVLADRAPARVADEPARLPWDAGPAIRPTAISRPGNRGEPVVRQPETAPPDPRNAPKGATLDAMGSQQILEMMKEMATAPEAKNLQKRAASGGSASLAGLARAYMEPASADARLDKLSSELQEIGPDEYLVKLSKPIEGEMGPETRALVREQKKKAIAEWEASSGKKMGKSEKKALGRMMELEATLPREFIDAIRRGSVKNKGWGDFTDWRRGLQGAGGRGITNNAVDRFILRPNERAHLIPDEIMAHVFGKLTEPVNGLPEADRKIFGEYMAAKSRLATVKAEGLDPAEIPVLESIIAARSRAASDRTKFLEAEAQMRDVFDWAYSRWDAARRARGKGELGYREDTYPVKQRRSGVREGVKSGGTILEKIQGGFRGAGENLSRMAEERSLQDPGDGPRNPKYFSGHAARRTGETELKDMVTDPYEVAKDYARDFAQATVFDGIIKHNLAYSEYLRLNGIDRLAKSIEDYTASVYANKPIGADLRIQQIANNNGAGGRLLLGAMEAMGQAFRASTFTLNTAWSMTTQGSSAALPAGKYAEHIPQAAATYLTPEFRRFVDQLYVPRMKGRVHGRVQDVGRAAGALDGARLGGRTKGEAISDGLGLLSKTVEAETVYWTAALAYHRGRSIGLDGKDLANFMSDNVAKFQSMYDKYNRANIMNNKAIAGTMPMQSFRIEMMNVIRETFGINGIGIKEPMKYGDKEMVVRFGGMIAAAMISDLVTDKVANKRNYSLLTPVPFASEFVPSQRALPGMPAPIRAMQPEFGGDSLIAGSLANVGKGAKEMFTGQPERGVGRAVRPFAPGGAQINNTLQTVAAARGAHAVDLDKDQITQILVSLFLGGPYATGPGRDVIDKYSGSGPSSGSAPTGQRSGTSRTGTSRGGASRGGQQR